MKPRATLLLAAILGVHASAAVAEAAAEPGPSTLARGARVRLKKSDAPNRWVKGALVSADSTSIALVPEEAPPPGGKELRVPSRSVVSLDAFKGRKRRWLSGLLIGAAGGTLVAFELRGKGDGLGICFVCSNSDVAITIFASAAAGAAVGALVKTDRWSNVALDRLPPPAPRAGRASARLQALPGGGVALGLTVGF